MTGQRRTMRVRTLTRPHAGDPGRAQTPEESLARAKAEGAPAENEQEIQRALKKNREALRAMQAALVLANARRRPIESDLSSRPALARLWSRGR